MSDLARMAPSLIDIAWQTTFRLGFPMAQRWWRLTRATHQGAITAIHVGGSLLLLRSSYRSAWAFPGGTIRPDEAPEAAARREINEEIGLTIDTPLQPAGVVRGLWEGRDDTVHLFALRLDRLPALRLDNREIVGARLATQADLPHMPMTGPVQAYVRDWLAAGRP